MAEYAAIPSCAKIHLQRNCYKVSQLIPRRNSCSRTVQRKHVYRKYGIAFRSSPWEVHEFSAPSTSIFERSLHIKERSLRCCCFGLSSMPSNGVVIVDQVLLMGSVILAYMAGVVPSKKTYYTSGKNVSDSDIRVDDSTSSGSAMQSDIPVDVGFAWDEVKAKLLGGLDAIQSDGNSDSRVVEYEKYNTKRPLSLYAIAGGPRLRLLLTTLQRLQKEVGNISGGYGNIGRSYWLAMISEIMQRCSMLVFDAWLEDELPLEKKKHDNANFQTLFKKLNGDDSILQNLKKSGKEDLYAEFLFLLRFGSVGVDCRYEMTFLSRHGVDILEDLVITLANGITSSYLELISVDSNMSSDMNRLGLDLCSMSTRALQRLRNEVALDRWLHQNLESVVSMYEDRFDLCTFGVQLLDDPSKGESKKLHWWQKLTLTPQMSISSLHYVVINQLSIAVKRTEELRALTGWRYYFSLFLEFSDIAMPLVKAVFAKISSAISFFLVCLIGRSLGLIYTGIRQSLGWRFFVKSCLIPGMIILLQLVGDMNHDFTSIQAIFGYGKLMGETA